MSAADRSAKSFVLAQLGDRRFALPADTIVELAPSLPLHHFPHTSPLLVGVIVRRARIVPVFDAASVLVGKRSSAHHFYLVARRDVGKASELSAIPVDAECELTSAELLPSEAGRPRYVRGRIAVGEELIDVLDFESLVSEAAAAEQGGNRQEGAG
ncbi:MAG TPA: chemotaxis protein CheW [Candidatus Cybelea sp.]|nr:chemotaxis protein CheW [Candidatus Cybelea sp.]